MSMLSLFGAIGLSAVCGLTPLANKRNAISLNESEGHFQIRFTTDSLLNKDMYAEIVARNTANGNHCFSTYHYWAGAGIEQGGSVNTYSNFFTYLPLENSNLSYGQDVRYFAVVDNVIYRKYEGNFYFFAFTRQYFCFDYFYNKSFSYGVPNYGGYADDICSYMHNDFVSPSGFTMKQGFLPYNDINYITSYVSNFSSDDEDFMSTSDFEYYSLEDIGSLGSYDCPFNAFNGRNYNVLLHQDSTPVYCYRLPYFYFLSYENSLENRFNLSDFFDNFEDTSWSFSFYGVDSTNNAYDTGFDNGYAVGHQDGYYEGVDDGRATGYENGYDDGYLVGRTDGIASANDYSFLSLFGAVADTPVLMIRSLFNFDFFGVNLLTVVLSLFTALILFYLLRKLF